MDGWMENIATFDSRCLILAAAAAAVEAVVLLDGVFFLFFPLTSTM